MKNKILFLLLLALAANFSQAQSQDSMQVQKYKKIFPGITLGWNRLGFSTGEAGLFIGLTNNSLKQTKAMTIIMHGPSVGCELGNYENAFRAAPKFSYECYTSFIGGRISLVDFMKNDAHNLYVSPEAGISFGAFLNIFAGANFHVSGEELPEVKTFRLTVCVNLLFFYLAKEKSGKTN